MQKLFLTTALCGLLIAGASAAQNSSNPDPVITAYREYGSAVARGDMLAAERAASRALAASEARDGGAGVTAVLAMNLALARMDLNHQAEAIAPATRALQLAEAGAKGVDPLSARLLLDDATLSTSPNGDEADLDAALKEAEARDPAAISQNAYSAAVTLGRAAVSGKHWDRALEAWNAAERYVAGAPGNLDLAKANALIGQGVALIALNHDSKADEVFTRAIVILTPLAPEVQDWDKTTIGEQALAEATVFRAAERARQLTEDRTISRDTTGGRPQLAGRPRLCSGTLTPHPLPTFPEAQLEKYSVGAAILRIHLDENGQVVQSRVLAAVPDEGFRQSVSAPEVKWQFKVSPEAKQGCRLDTTDRLLVVNFAIR